MKVSKSRPPLVIASDLGMHHVTRDAASLSTASSAGRYTDEIKRSKISGLFRLLCLNVNSFKYSGR